jgi:hypothetical protein
VTAGQGPAADEQVPAWPLDARPRARCPGALARRQCFWGRGTEEQARQGHCLGAQLRSILDYIERRGWTCSGEWWLPGQVPNYLDYTPPLDRAPGLLFRPPELVLGR